MSDTDRLAELLIEVFPATNRNQWPFAATDVAAALIAAGVRVAPSPTCKWCGGAVEPGKPHPDIEHRSSAERVAPSPECWCLIETATHPGAKVNPDCPQHGVALSPETPGLREAAQAYLDAFDMPLTTDPEVHYDTLTAAREALRAALASPPVPAGLDVERLARAIRVTTDPDFTDWDAEAIAREYAAQSTEPTP